MRELILINTRVLFALSLLTSFISDKKLSNPVSNFPLFGKFRFMLLSLEFYGQRITETEVEADYTFVQ